MRKLAELSAHLPSESATKQAISESSNHLHGWTLNDVLVARLIEIQTGQQIVPESNNQAGGKPDAPTGPKIKKVSVGEAMGFVTTKPHEFESAVAGTKE